jgi:hypothetical protein
MITEKLPIQGRLKTLGDFLPYVAVTRDFIVSQDPAQLTAVLETRVSELDDDSVIQARHDRLMDVFCDIMPPNATVSIYLTKRFIKEKIPYRTECENPLIKFLDDATIDTFNAKLYPHYACFFAITIPASSSKSMSFAKKTEKEKLELNDVSEAAENLNNLIHAIKSRVPGSIFRLNSQQILGFLVDSQLKPLISLL